MAALSAPLFPQTGGSVYYYFPAPMAASVTCYNGGMIACNTSTGYFLEASDTSGYVWTGIAQIPSNTPTPGVLVNGTTAGATSVNVTVPISNQWLMLPIVSGVQGNVGKLAAVLDDQTVQLNSAATNHVVIGRIMQLINTTSVMVNPNDKAPANGSSTT